MAERDSGDRGVLDVAEQLGLAAVGAVSLTAEKVDELADELAERGGMRRDEARAFVRDLVSRWRGDAVRVGERTGAGLHGAFRQLGLVLREEYEELELRVAQLEHRLRLLERAEEQTASLPPH
jgi:polyhydroxyalkanoate synthesis regulator phasin